MIWTVEEHELSEGYSCIVYDEHGQAIADHLDSKRAHLIAAAPELYEVLDIIIANAALGPDPTMNGSTDCYAVPIEDIETAQAALAKARGEHD